MNLRPMASAAVGGVVGVREAGLVLAQRVVREVRGELVRVARLDRWIYEGALAFVTGICCT